MGPCGRELLLKLLEKDPDRRITALQALQHPWLAEGTGAPGGGGSEEDEAAPDLELEDEVLVRLRRHAVRSRFQRLSALTITAQVRGGPFQGPRAI